MMNIPFIIWRKINKKKYASRKDQEMEGKIVQKLELTKKAQPLTVVPEEKGDRV